MSADEQEPAFGAESPLGKKRTRWFRPNRMGVGWHPGSWQGWLVIALIVAVIVTVVVLFRTGAL